MISSEDFEHCKDYLLQCFVRGIVRLRSNPQEPNSNVSVEL